jgi:hypothetical protein
VVADNLLVVADNLLVVADNLLVVADNLPAAVEDNLAAVVALDTLPMEVDNLPALAVLDTLPMGAPDNRSAALADIRWVEEPGNQSAVAAADNLLTVVEDIRLTEALGIQVTEAVDILLAACNHQTVDTQSAAANRNPSVALVDTQLAVDNSEASGNLEVVGSQSTVADNPLGVLDIESVVAVADNHQVAGNPTVAAGSLTVVAGSPTVVADNPLVVLDIESAVAAADNHQVAGNPGAAADNLAADHNLLELAGNPEAKSEIRRAVAGNQAAAADTQSGRDNFARAAIQSVGIEALSPADPPVPVHLGPPVCIRSTYCQPYPISICVEVCQLSSCD